MKKIILASLSYLLPATLGSILNPKNQYRAIIVDEPNLGKNILTKAGYPESQIYTFYELDEILHHFYFDYVICVSDSSLLFTAHEHFSKCGLPREKFVHICLTPNNDPFLVKRTLDYYDKHAEDFEIFSTGISYSAVAIDANQFKRKLLNLARSSQDLYYDYQVAKHVLTPKTGGGGGKIKYALIGLAPYSFSYDLSMSYGTAGRILPYFIALNDLHNFWMPPEEYRNLFNPQYLALRLPPEIPDINNVYFEKSALRTLNATHRVIVRTEFSAGDKIYPATQKENVQILDDYLSLCENNSVKPIVFCPPVTELTKKATNNYKAAEFYYTLSTILRKHPKAGFVDGWKINGFTDQDFYDRSHLNINGAAKFSAIFNSFIARFDSNY